MHSIHSPDTGIYITSKYTIMCVYCIYIYKRIFIYTYIYVYTYTHLYTCLQYIFIYGCSLHEYTYMIVHLIIQI